MTGDASTGLPLFTVRGWDGPWGVGRRQGSGPIGHDVESFPIGYDVEGFAVDRDVEGSGDRMVSIAHSRPGASIAVTSHRREPGGLRRVRRWAPVNTISAALRNADSDGDLRRQAAIDQEIARLHDAARRDELVWDDIAISVDGRPMPFQLFRVNSDCWVAVGSLPVVDLSIDSQSVSLAGLALVSAPDIPNR